MRIEGMLDAGGGMQRIRSLIGRIDQRARAAIRVAGKASRIARLARKLPAADSPPSTRSPSRSAPDRCRTAQAGAQDRVLRFSQRIGDSQSRRERQAIIMRSAGMLEQRNLQSLQRQQRGIIQLGLAGSGEESEAKCRTAGRS